MDPVPDTQLIRSLGVISVAHFLCLKGTFGARRVISVRSMARLVPDVSNLRFKGTAAARHMRCLEWARVASIHRPADYVLSRGAERLDFA
jgi:hypothetical protein